MKKTAYVGVDYHVNTLTLAVKVEGTNDFYETIHLINEDKIIKKYLRKLSERYELRICYEACSSGYTFQRKLISWGYHCDVIAPSLVPRKPGDRRKNDFRDARNLAHHYANGMLTIVHPPSEYEESVRSLIRCRLALKDSSKKAKQLINTFLLSQGCRWHKTKWTAEHRRWLSTLEMPHENLQTVLDEYFAHLSYLYSRLQHLDKKIEALAHSEIYEASVKKLRAFRGINTLTAMVLIAEITDFRRFSNPRALMAFLGLIPSEKSSGEKKKGGSITKTGNSRCRTHLIESMQHCGKKPYISKKTNAALAESDAQNGLIATSV